MRSPPPPRSCGARARGTSSSSCPASGRSARPASCCDAAWPAGPTPATWSCCRCTRGSRSQDQQRVFAPSRGRRVVLATNVAETSLTVPGIRYVIDTGLARVKRYSVRNKTTQLRSRRSRNPRRTSGRDAAGACRTASACGCTREDDFAARPAYTDPEILRSSLAAVILRMARSSWAPSRPSRSSTRRRPAPLRTASSCCRSSGRSTRHAH